VISWSGSIRCRRSAAGVITCPGNHSWHQRDDQVRQYPLLPECCGGDYLSRHHSWHQRDDQVRQYPLPPECCGGDYLSRHSQLASA